MAWTLLCYFYHHVSGNRIMHIYAGWIFSKGHLSIWQAQGVRILHHELLNLPAKTLVLSSDQSELHSWKLKCRTYLGMIYSTVDWMAIFFVKRIGITEFCQKWQESAFALVFFQIIRWKRVNSNVTRHAELYQFDLGPRLKRHMKCWKQWMNSGRSCRRPEVVLRCSYDLQPSSNIWNMEFCVIP